MVNEGRLAPVVDVVQALRDEAAGAGNSAKGSGGGGGGGGRGGGGGEDSGKGGGKRQAGRKDVSRAHRTYMCLLVCCCTRNLRWGKLNPLGFAAVPYGGGVQTTQINCTQFVSITGLHS